MTTPVHKSVPARARRLGFTLIELLVVMFLMAILAGLGVLVVMNVKNDERAPRGAMQVQQWLQIAKQRALRDRANRGVRLLPNSSNTSWVTELQYIEQPDDFMVQPGVVRDPFDSNQDLGRKRALPFRRITTPDPAKLYQVVLEAPDPYAQAPYPDFSGGFSATDFALWPVQVGDYLVVNDGIPHRIDSVDASNPNLPQRIDRLTLKTAAPNPVFSPLPTRLSSPTANYRILRAPRVVGDEQLQLPADIVIDLNTDTLNTLPRDPLTGNIDLLFSPSGELVGRGTGADTIYLWVRDSTLPTIYEGDPTIIAVYTRSGNVAAHPVDRPPSIDPYAFTKDGRASGL